MSKIAITAIAIIVTTTMCFGITALNERNAKIKQERATSPYQPGTICQVVNSNAKVVIISQYLNKWLCRIDNGPHANPRFTTESFIQEELIPLPQIEK